MDKQDQTLDCCDCSAPFLYTAGEQQFYEDRGLLPPKRCKTCRIAKQKARGMQQRQYREMHEVTCATCGALTQVPFVPKPDRPVYCREHMPARK